MYLLRIFRHGPLLFWMAAVSLLASTTYLASEYSFAPSPQRPQTESEVDRTVESWRMSLAQLPVLAAAGTVSPFAESLSTAARSNASEATRSGSDEMAAAWMSAAMAAERLAAAEDGGSDAVQAAIREVGLAGDRLLAASAGVPWIETDLPERLDILPTEPPADEQLSQ